jgi:hypothetical protein
MKRLFLAVLGVAISCLTVTPAHAQFAVQRVSVEPGWGIKTGRASGSDVARLHDDLTGLLNAEREQNRWRDRRISPIAVERQNQILGIGGGISGEDANIDLKEDLRKRRPWIDYHILQPALAIAANPATTCSLAKSMMLRAAELGRQEQMLFVEGENVSSEDGLGSVPAVMSLAYDIVARRCLEEAYDECVSTGNVGGFVSMMSLTRERERYGKDDAASDDQFLYLVRRCAVYKLDYSIGVQASAPRLLSEWQGSYVLLFYAHSGADLETRFWAGNWQDDKLDATPPDIRLLNVTCPRFHSDCKAMPHRRGDGEGAVALLRFRHTELEQHAHVRYDETNALDRQLGGRVEVSENRRTDGENRFELYFDPPHIFLQSRVGGRLEEASPAIGTDWYEAANVLAPHHQDRDVPLMANKGNFGGEHPHILSATGIPRAPYYDLSSTSRFELTHRPDLYPADEIEPSLEVTETQPQPKRGPPVPFMVP